MPKFRHKPVVFEAFRLGARGEPTPAPAWFGSPHPSRITDDGLILPTPDGDRLARWGDWIVRGLDGEIYPCKPSIFDATCELVEDDPGAGAGPSS
jgi:hypothetical protein